MVRKEIPRLYDTENIPVEEKVIFEHYFLPGTAWEWYIAEVDDTGRTAFGYVCSGLDPNFSEWGYIDMKELREVKATIDVRQARTGASVGSFEQPVEKDLGWFPKNVKEIDSLVQRLGLG